MSGMSDVEFDLAMRDIDESIRQDGHPIPGREMRAMCRFCEKYRTSLHMDSPLRYRIQGWYENTYGERLAVDWSYGSSVAIVQGDVYELQCVRLYGTEIVTASVLLFDKEIDLQTPDGTVHRMKNLLDGRVVGLTPTLGRRVSENDCAGIVDAYGRMFTALHGIDAAVGKRFGGTDAPYIKEAKHDISSSVKSLLSSPPNYGQAKWDSLQVVEKVVKSCIAEKGATHGKSHKLSALCDIAEAAGVPVVDRTKIATIQCPADVRYDSTMVTKGEAIAAHYASLDVIAQLAPVVKRTTAEALVVALKSTRPDGTEDRAFILSYSPHHPNRAAGRQPRIAPHDEAL